MEIRRGLGLALIAVDKRLFVNFYIICGDHASFSGGDDLSWKKRKRRCSAKSPRHPSIIGGAVRMGCILKKPKPMLLANLLNFGHAGRHDTGNMHDDDTYCLRPDRPPESVNIN